ncbi:LurX regulator protein [Nostoc phage A1]|nr:LurX regulator protein [Nostoc phage A1]
MNELPPKIDLKHCLSDLEIEVLNEICKGLRKREIAEKLHKSVGAINHVTQVLYSKLNCKNYIDLFKVSHGFLPVPEKIIESNNKGVEKIIELFENGLKPRQIAERTGRTVNHIYAVTGAYKAIKKAERNKTYDE